jgi:hypothetical protein
MTRYQMLREAIAILAAPANEQVAYLDRIFIECTGGGSAAAYGNDELALGLDDTFLATNHMMEFGEISADEVAAIKPLNDHFTSYWQPEDTTFWQREALFDDPRWQDVRALARTVLNQLPDESRESEYTRSLENEANGS